MKNRKQTMRLSALSLAVQGALAAMCVLPMMAQAADAAADTTTPTNTVEVGAGYVSESSAKFGEYNGLNQKGGVFLGDFDVRGGEGYKGASSASRWSIRGLNLGTTSRSIDGAVGDQGRWGLRLGYDELRQNLSDTYQTPQQGGAGSNYFTVPADFGTVQGNITPAAQVQPTYQNQMNSRHLEDVSTTLKNTSFGAGFYFNPRVNLTFDYNHLDQSGAKLLGTGASGGVTIPGSSGTWRAEGNNIVMNPNQWTTDTFNLALNWRGDQGHITASYYASIFRNDYDSFSFNNVITNNATGACAPGGNCQYQRITMGTAPDNSLQQFNLTGGYTFSPTTKLAGGFSYGRNTQNSAYLTGQPELMATPTSSLDGLVVTTHADVKLTNQTTRDLTLSAGLKYNERDNQSSSNLYAYHAINNVSASNLGYAAYNAPYSNRKTQFEAAADYRLAKGQTLRAAYAYDDIKRWCNSYRTDAVSGDNSCQLYPRNTENTLSLAYRLKAANNVNFLAGYSYSDRSADFDGNPVTPLAGATTAAGIGMDVNAQNFPGYVAYPYAARTQNQVKAGVTWAANEKLDLSLSGRYAKNNYDATLGLQDGSTSAISLDATYAYSPKGSVSAYASWQSNSQNLNAGAAGSASKPAAPGVNLATSYAALVAPGNIFSTQQHDDSNAVGLTTRHNGLMGGKLELLGDLSYFFGRTSYSTQVPYLPTCGAANVLTCGDTPDIKSQLVTFKLTGIYQIDPKSRIALAYQYQKLVSSDYYYNGLQYGTTPNRVLPTSEQAANYAVNYFGVSYIYSFK